MLRNISRRKSNHIVKFGQLTEYNISAKKSYTKCGGKTIPGPFSKKSKLSLSQYQ